MHRRSRRTLPALLLSVFLSVVVFLGVSTYLLPGPGTHSLSAPTTPTAAASPASTGCVPQLTPGTTTVQVTFSGQRYPVRVHLPEESSTQKTEDGTREDLPDQATSAAGQESPALVLDLHGSDANATAQAQVSGLDEVADAHGFVVAQPTAAIPLDSANPLPDGNWAWNVPGVPMVAGEYPPEDARDDVAFLAAVVDHLVQAACVDSQRVYATGFSGGGRMASALACARPDLLAAIAPVAGLRAGRAAYDDASQTDPLTCDPATEVPVLTFHGTDDWVNPYEGSADPRWGYSVDTALGRWAELNQCTEPPAQTQVSEQVLLTSYDGCPGGSGRVQGYTLAGAGHTWPGSEADFGELGTVSQEIGASELMWEFFAKHPGR
ncbi:alpha/beta hydrolase family esterase [Actinomyces wuliandei]|uniref:alpha/beta hydrolase family esterase n=1 Tax=Actinomyces wuliandei TaxID=2057743 RepID=UPI000FDAC655|nr:PHB depolymerase family esterase [Actinomyces wuliandei]